MQKPRWTSLIDTPPKNQLLSTPLRVSFLLRQQPSHTAPFSLASKSPGGPSIRSHRSPTTPSFVKSIDINVPWGYSSRFSLQGDDPSGVCKQIWSFLLLICLLSIHFQALLLDPSWKRKKFFSPHLRISFIKLPISWGVSSVLTPSIQLPDVLAFSNPELLMLGPKY